MTNNFQFQCNVLPFCLINYLCGTNNFICVFLYIISNE